MSFGKEDIVSIDETPFVHFEGIFYRAVDPAFRAHAIAGSINPGRYSRSDQPTLYLSSSPEGVKAAMVAHKENRNESLSLVSVHVSAHHIFDLRNEVARNAAGINLDDAIAPWQAEVAKGGTPRSWHVRAQLEAMGAQGLIDPSRKAPGLWHLVLFAWNQNGTAKVELSK